MNKFEKYIVKEIKRVTKLKDISLEVPPDSKMGDYAFPCFVLAKSMKKAPNKIAEELAGKIKKNNILAEVKTIGPYLNFYVNKKEQAKDVLLAIQKEAEFYGKSHIGKERIVIEYPAPNTNKPLHLGHVRNMVLGKSCSLLLEEIGNDVVQVNLVNDRGVHICKSMLAYQKWGKNKEPDRKGDFFVGDYYVMFNQKAKDMPGLEEEAQELLRKWESGDKETLKLWKKMRKWALVGFNETYKKFNVSFKKEYYESEIYTYGRDLVNNAFKKGLLVKDETGAVYADLEKYKMPNKFLLRADGTTLYMTQDLYLAVMKHKDFKFTSSVYVVGNEQNLHFQQLFKILELLGHSWAKKCYHLSYGMVYLPEGRMKSREGTVVDADDLVNEVVNAAKVEIEIRHGDNLTSKQIEKRAKMVGMGALKFFILKMDPSKDMVYDPNESLSLEGETGPYVQYTHARINSVLKKVKTGNVVVDFKSYETDEELKIINILGKYPSVVVDAAKHYKPSIICRYLIDLCQAFNEFYQNITILKAEDKQKKARLFLLECVKQVIVNGLKLLDIEAPKAM
ncbi:MAG: arginine--tRNA ligase [Nanoarchaeota archaeon]|nr:arginine--tRNA ligase [Nanoarchaeota archaeon]